MCSRQGCIPKAMFIDICLDGDFIEGYSGNGTTVVKGDYNGCAVAMKMLRLYLTSDLNHSVKASITTLYC